MNRLDSMLERLPANWRIEKRSVLHQLLGVITLALSAYDEDVDRVQRSHWIDHAFDREDLEKLGAMFDIAAAPWEPDRFFRERLKATIAARLRGAVTRADMEYVLSRIVQGADDSMGMRLFRPRAGQCMFHEGSTDDPLEPAFVEFPIRRVRCSQLAAQGGLVKPLDFIEINCAGLRSTKLEMIIRGMPKNRTAVPVIANLTNGTVLGYAGCIRCGQELKLTADPEGLIQARLDGVNVTDRIFSSDQFVPGERWEPAIPDPQPKPIRLELGSNRLWFISMALFDVDGLDAAMLQVPTPELRQGIFADAAESMGTDYNLSLFHQEPAAVIDAWWEEEQAAAFRFEIPVGLVRREAGRSDCPELDFERMIALLEQTVDMLRAAGVDGGVLPRPLSETQCCVDKLAMPGMETTVETNEHKAALVALSAIFDFTAKDGSRFE